MMVSQLFGALNDFNMSVSLADAQMEEIKRLIHIRASPCNSCWKTKNAYLYRCRKYTWGHQVHTGGRLDWTHKPFAFWTDAATRSDLPTGSPLSHWHQTAGNCLRWSSAEKLNNRKNNILVSCSIAFLQNDTTKLVSDSSAHHMRCNW